MFSIWLAEAWNTRFLINYSHGTLNPLKYQNEIFMVFVVWLDSRFLPWSSVVLYLLCPGTYTNSINTIIRNPKWFVIFFFLQSAYPRGLREPPFDCAFKYIYMPDIIYIYTGGGLWFALYIRRRLVQAMVMYT